MFPLLQLGPLALRLPGLFLLSGLWLGLRLVEKESRRQKLPTVTIYNLVFYGVVAGVIGARLWYAGRYFSVYWADPLSLFSLNPATLAPSEGLLTGFLVALIYGQRQGLTLWPTLDALTPGLALFAMFLGIAHLASGDAFGAPTELPWGIQLWGEVRHPSQVYEIIAAGLIVLAARRLQTQSRSDGVTFLAWTALTASCRLFLEAFRGDSVIVLGSVRAAQLVSLMVLLLALWGMRARSVQQQPSGREL